MRTVFYLALFFMLASASASSRTVFPTWVGFQDPNPPSYVPPGAYNQCQEPRPSPETGGGGYYCAPNYKCHCFYFLEHLADGHGDWCYGVRNGFCILVDDNGCEARENEDTCVLDGQVPECVKHGIEYLCL